VRFGYLPQGSNGTIIWQNLTNNGTRLGFEPLSVPGKAVVTAHGDMHQGNVIVDNTKEQPELLAIDFEFTHVGWAANDLSYQFGNDGLKDSDGMHCGSYEGFYKYIERYLQQSGYPHTKEDVDLLIFDCRCAKLRNFWPAKVNRFLDKCIEYNDLKLLDAYYALEAFEKKARTDPKLREAIIHKWIEEAALELDPEYAQLFKEYEAFLIECAHKNIKKHFGEQIEKREKSCLMNKKSKWKKKLLKKEL